MVAVAIVMPLLVRRQKKKLAGIEPMLRERGGLTLDEIAVASKTGMFGKGYLMQALDQLAAQGKLTKVPPPAGHPRLRIARDTKYQLKA